MSDVKHSGLTLDGGNSACRSLGLNPFCSHQEASLFDKEPCPVKMAILGQHFHKQTAKW